MSPRLGFLRSLCALTHEPRDLVLRTFLVFLGVELALVAMHFVATDVFAAAAASTTDGHIGGFDLDDEATLAVWFSSFQLLLLSCVSLFAAWAHEATDGRGTRSRIWRVAAVVFFVIAIDETAGLHEVAGQLFAGVFPFVPVHPSVWWTIPYALGVAPLIGYLCLSSRSRPQLALAAALGAVCWFGANTLERVVILARSRNVALEEGLEMFGASLLLLAVASYFLDVMSHEEDAAVVADSRPLIEPVAAITALR